MIKDLQKKVESYPNLIFSPLANICNMLTASFTQQHKLGPLVVEMYNNYYQIIISCWRHGENDSAIVTYPAGHEQKASEIVAFCLCRIARMFRVEWKLLSHKQAVR